MAWTRAGAGVGGEKDANSRVIKKIDSTRFGEGLAMEEVSITVKLPWGCQWWVRGEGRDDENYLDLLSLRARGRSGGGIQIVGEIRSGGIHMGVGRLLIDRLLIDR